ncbi:MAG: hypothetical protein N3F09_08090 [Bacteroidia bacterium]|nr:hypothetical protein [Bacteroidia bacterium]
MKNKIQTSPKNKASVQSILDWTDRLLSKINERKFLLFFIFLTLMFDLLNFNLKISEAHDDALYIEAAYRYIHEFPDYFYTANAPLYPMFLAFLMLVFGFKLWVFKLFNVLFHLGFVTLTFLTFKNVLRKTFLFFIMMFVSINFLMVYYSSMTFTEQMFLFIQSLLLFFMHKYFQASDADFQNHISFFRTEKFKLIVIASFFVFVLNITRNISISVVPSVFLMLFLFNEHRKFSFIFLLFYIVFQGIFRLMVYLIWPLASSNQYKSQTNILLLKDPYDASKGKDDIVGFLERLITNIDLYLSKRFFQILGITSEESTDTHTVISVLMILLMLISIWHAFKNKSYFVLLIAFYVSALLGSTFLVLQARWDQPRFILVGMPLLFVVWLYFFQVKIKSSVFHNILAVLLIFLSFSIIISTFKRTQKNYKIALKNMKGDIYYGYTPDIINFMKCSKWCAENLPEDALVASRKAPMSFVYSGGKHFFPLYSVIKKDTATDQSHPDSALVFFKKNKVTHIMLPSLRLNPQQPGFDAMSANPANPNDLTYIFYRQGVINTFHNILYPIYAKYPQKLKLIHVEGQLEECYLFEFQYDK